MKIEVETISAAQRRLAIEVPWNTIKEELDEAYRGLAKRARVKGFRAGKVPRKLLEQIYRTTVEGEVLNRILDDSYKKAIAEKSLMPINSPTLDETPTIEPDTPLKFVATVEVKPEIDVKTYKGLQVTQKVRAIADEDIAKELEQLRTKAMVIEQVTDRKTVEEGDLAVIDFFGYIGGETFKGGKGINYTVEVGAKQMIPGFEQELIGMNIGDQKNFQLTFPKDQGAEEARGKKVDWKVDLKEIKRKILPELDDEFAKDLGEYDSLSELKDKVRENLKTRESAKSRQALRNLVLEKLAEENTVDVPPLMVERQLDFALQDVKRAVESSKDLAMQGTLEKLRADGRARAETQVAGMLLLEAVAREEAIEVSDADLEARIQELAREHRIGLKQLKEQLKDQEQIESLRYNLRQDKALDLVVAHAQVTEEPEDEAPSDP